MKTKIQSTIKLCNECIYAKEFQEKTGNSDHVLICCFENEIDNINDTQEPFDSFLIMRHHEEPKKRFSIEIPDNCPLEDYENRT